MRTQTVEPATATSRRRVLQHGWLAACPPDFRNWAAGALIWHGVRRGQEISWAGDTEGGIMCAEEGQFTFFTSFGGVLVTAYFGFPGSWWGFAPMVGAARAGTCAARTDGLVGMIPQTALRARLADHPEDWEHLARCISDMFMCAAGAHSDMLIERSENRLAAIILRLGGLRHRLFPLQPPSAFCCTQEELARAAGISRNTAGIHLRHFEQMGLIQRSYGEIEILDPHRLAIFADSET